MDNDIQAKLSELMGGQVGPEAAQRLREILLAQVENTPQKPIHMLMRRMLETNAAKSAATGGSTGELASLRKLLRAASRELKALDNRQRQLAAALGACAECWGQDFECDVCGGAGGPGWTDPDENLFDRYVAPALRRTDPRRG